MRKRSRMPRDPSKLAKKIIDLATTEESEPAQADDGKNPAAVALGALGASKGGQARAKRLSAKRRREIAKKAAASRWRKTRIRDR